MSVMFFKAINFAEKKHKGQIRKGSKKPYVSHPQRVADLLGRFKDSSVNYEALLAAAMLHDTVEDTDTSIEEIREEFGDLVANIVKELTSDEKMIAKVGKAEYLMKKMVKLSSYGLLLKLLDRLDNVTDGPSKKYVKDTLMMMDYIKQNKRLTKTQTKVVDEIIRVCMEFPLMEVVSKYL